MPFFTQAQATNIYGGMFTDIRGNQTLIQGDPTLQLLLSATATGAAYNSQERYPPPKCHRGTREDVLGGIEDWIATSMDSSRGGVMWLHGPAGAGKSAIAQTICESSVARGQLAASFFFSRGDVRRGSMQYFFTTIALQMAMSNCHLRDRIVKVVHGNPLVVHEAITATQVEHLIAGPLRLRTPVEMNSRPPFLIVVDGLDECRGNDHQSLLLNILIDLVLEQCLPLHILVVSRPEPHIKHIFDTVKSRRLRTMSLYGDHQAYADIYSFLRHGFEKIHHSERHWAVMRFVRRPWPSEQILNTLTYKSGGYFVYPSTVLRFVDEEYCSPVSRLEEIVNASPTSSTTAFAELDKLYAQILSTNSSNRALMKRILGCILLPVTTEGSVPITVSMIELLLNLRPGEVMMALRGLHSILSFAVGHQYHHTGVAPEPGEIHIQSLHASLADFTFNEERAGVFFIDPQEHHIYVALTSWGHFTNRSEVGLSKAKTTNRQFLLDSFLFHFQQIHDKHLILETLDTANKDIWAPLVQKSKGWDVGDQHKLVRAVENVIQAFKALVPLPQDTVRELTELLGFMFSAHLSPRSQGTIRFIQGIYGMFRSLKSDDTTAQLLRLSHLVEPSWKHIHVYMTTWGARDEGSFSTCLCKRQSFLDFMSNVAQSGNLFVNPGTCHSRLAFCCMENLLSNNPQSAIFHIRLYAADSFSKHVLKVPAGEEKLLHYFRDLARNRIFPVNRGYYGISFIETVIAWLNGTPNPPMGILLPWRTFLEDLKSTTWKSYEWHSSRSSSYSQESFDSDASNEYYNTEDHRLG